MKIKLLLILAIASTFTQAQNNFFVPDTNATQLLINGAGGVGSTGITQEFMNKFLFPGFIDQELKTATSDQLSDENVFGGELNFDAHVYLKPGSLKGNSFWGIGFGHTTEGNLNFTKDMFDLTFFGNQPFAGVTLDLNNTSFKSVSYSYLDFTIGHTFKKAKATHAVWADLGLVLGHNYSNFDLPTATILTEQVGNYLDINIQDGLMEANDTLSTNFIQGIGGKVNLSYSYSAEKKTFLFQAKNIGGISWSRLTSSNIDSTFRFEGIEINNIFQLSDSVLNEVTSIDSLIDTEKTSAFKALPIDLSAYYKQNMGLITWDVLVRHRLFANYTPYARAGVYFNLPFVTPGVTVAYGGYSALQVGLNCEVTAIKNLKIILGTNNLLGAVIPTSSTALDSYIGIKFNL